MTICCAHALNLEVCGWVTISDFANKVVLGKGQPEQMLWPEGGLIFLFALKQWFLFLWFPLVVPEKTGQRPNCWC